MLLKMDLEPEELVRLIEFLYRTKGGQITNEQAREFWPDFNSFPPTGTAERVTEMGWARLHSIKEINGPTGTGVYGFMVTLCIDDRLSYRHFEDHRHQIKSAPTPSELIANLLEFVRNK